MNLFVLYGLCYKDSSENVGQKELVCGEGKMLRNVLKISTTEKQ